MLRQGLLTATMWENSLGTELDLRPTVRSSLSRQQITVLTITCPWLHCLLFTNKANTPTFFLPTIFSISSRSYRSGELQTGVRYSFTSQENTVHSPYNHSLLINASSSSHLLGRELPFPISKAGRKSVSLSLALSLAPAQHNLHTHLHISKLTDKQTKQNPQKKHTTCCHSERRIHTIFEVVETKTLW